MRWLREKATRAVAMFALGSGASLIISGVWSLFDATIFGGALILCVICGVSLALVDFLDDPL